MQKKALKDLSLRFDNYVGNVFYSTFIFMFLFINNNLMLIYFSNTLSTQEKIDLLAKAHILYLQPFFYALILAIGYLALNFLFYYLTLEYNKYKTLLGNKYLTNKEKIKNIKEMKALEKLKQQPILAPKSTNTIKIKNQGYEN